VVVYVCIEVGIVLVVIPTL